MKLDALDHPKTFDFAARLGVELPTALGHLELLWAFTGKQAPQGNIGKWPDGAIARACYWMGRPEVFLLALREAGFIDADPVHRFTVHDWHDHAPRWVRSKLAREGVAIYCSADCSGDCSPDDSADCSGDSVREGKSKEVKGREVKRACARDDSPGQAPEAAPELPPGLDPAVWKRWHDYRREIRKPLKPVSLPAAQRELAAFGCDQSAVVEQSIANGWQGLFALKPKASGSAPKRERPPTETEIAEARKRAAAENADVARKLGLPTLAAMPP